MNEGSSSAACIDNSANCTRANQDEPSYFKILNCWSLGGVGTSVLIESRMGTRIALDVGSTPIIHETVSASIVLVSHGHLDHSGGLFSHARAHYLLFHKIPTYYMPIALVDKVRNVERAMWDLDSAKLASDNEGFCNNDSTFSAPTSPPPGMPIHIVGVKPGDEIPLSSTAQRENLLIRVFQVQHEGHPSVGYVICRKLPQRLLPEFVGLPSNEIRDFVAKGIKVKEKGETVVELSYTGDTCSEGLCLPSSKNSDIESLQCLNSDLNVLHLRQAFQAPVIICELTYLDGNVVSLGGSRGHMHIGDVAHVFSSHGWNNNNKDSSSLKGKTVIFVHFSARHNPARRALELLQRNLPEWIIPYTYCAISSLLSKEEKLGGSNFPIELVGDNGCIQLEAYRATMLLRGAEELAKTEDE